MTVGLGTSAAERVHPRVWPHGNDPARRSTGADRTGGWCASDPRLLPLARRGHAGVMSAARAYW